MRRLCGIPAVLLLGLAHAPPVFAQQPTPGRPLPELTRPRTQPRKRTKTRPAAPRPGKSGFRYDYLSPSVSGRGDTYPWWHWSYLIDWTLAVGATASAYWGIGAIPPPERPFDPNDSSIGLPHQKNTVSKGMLIGLSTGIPLATFALMQIGWKSGHDFHHAALGLTEALALTLFFTQLLKVTVGRLRPDFLDQCRPYENLQCTGNPDDVAEARRSFPSGHSSFAFASATYLTLYLWGKLRPFNGWGAFWKIPVLLAPLGLATATAVSRRTDNRHHWEDIVVGSLLGVGFAALAYRLNFPAPWAKESDIPLRRRRGMMLLPMVSTRQVGLAIHSPF